MLFIYHFIYYILTCVYNTCNLRRLPSKLRLKNITMSLNVLLIKLLIKLLQVINVETVFV